MTTLKDFVKRGFDLEWVELAIKEYEIYSFNDLENLETDDIRANSVFLKQKSTEKGSYEPESYRVIPPEDLSDKYSVKKVNLDDFLDLLDKSSDIEEFIELFYVKGISKEPLIFDDLINAGYDFKQLEVISLPEFYFDIELGNVSVEDFLNGEYFVDYDIDYDPYQDLIFNGIAIESPEGRYYKISREELVVYLNQAKNIEEFQKKLDSNIALLDNNR